MRPQPFVTNIAVNSFADVVRNIEMVVHNTNMRQHNNLLWQGAKAALEFLMPYKDHGERVYMILGAPGPHQAFVEIENEGGFSVAVVPEMTEYPGHPGLFRLGPFLASVQKPGQNPAQAAQAKDAQSPPRDGSPESPAPVETSDLPVPIVD